MFTSSHHRIPRSIGFKVKHALQISIVLGVCIWLIYQVGHSGEDTKTVDEAVKLNRKDLRSRVDESSVIDTRHREEESEEESRHEEQNNLDDTNGVEDEHRQNSVDQETEESSENSTRDNESEEHNQYSSQENDNMGNKENEQNINEVEDKESSQISEEKSQQENEEMRDASTENKESEDINQDRDEMKKHGVVKSEQDSKEDKEERNATENERVENDKIREVASSEDRAQDGEMKNEVPRDEHYTSTNASNAKEAAHVDQKESVSNVTESETTEVANSNVITTKQGNSSEDQAETQNDSQNNLSGYGVETLHLQNGTDTTSNTTERQIETSEKSSSKVSDSTSSLNNTMLKAEDSKLDAAREQASPTLTDSSEIHESNVTNVEYRDTSGNSAESEIANNYSIQEGIPELALSPNTNSNKDASKEVQLASSELKNDESSKFENSTNNIENNDNENANDSDVVPLNATNSSISEEKDASLKNNVDAGQVENEKTAWNKKSENESVESQKEKEESTHLDSLQTLNIT